LQAENARLRETSERYRRRAENLMSLAMELRPSLHLPGFVERFTTHAAELLGAGAAALALARSAHLEIVFLHGSATTADKAGLRQLSATLTTLAAEHPEPVCDGPAAELLGPALAESLGWRDVELARMTGSEGDLLGVLCLADRGRELSSTDRELLLALAGHASITLENSRLFSTIEQSRKQWVEVFDAITDFIVVHDQNNRILRVNRPLANMVGVPPTELIGVSMRALNAIAPGGALEACPFCHVERDESGECIYTAEERTYLISTSRTRSGPDDGTRTIHVLKDITDAAVLQAKLRLAEKMAAVGQLVSGVAHEVNNPLAAILGFTDLLLENEELPESAKDSLRLILQEAERTKVIVQNLLSFARQMPPQRKPVQLNAILRRTLQLRSYDFVSHGLEMVQHLTEDLPVIVGDSQQLQQVFLNILNNAYDALGESRRPGRIEIDTYHRDGFAEVLFRDNGPGIAFPDRIFDPFFTTKEVGRGTGLGLSICYGIVREHGGEILCHNNVGQEGSTFIVRLPVAAQAAAVAGAEGNP
jgi:two-component system NtrC family sensor kinase